MPHPPTPSFCECQSSTLGHGPKNQGSPVGGPSLWSLHRAIVGGLWGSERPTGRLGSKRARKFFEFCSVYVVGRTFFPAWALLSDVDMAKKIKVCFSNGEQVKGPRILVHGLDFLPHPSSAKTQHGIFWAQKSFKQNRTSFLGLFNQSRKHISSQFIQRLTFEHKHI